MAGCGTIQPIVFPGSYLMLIKNSARMPFIIIVLVLAAAAVMGQNPGTAGDPLVSKSYIDHFLRFRAVVLPENSELKPETGAMFVVRSGQLRIEAAAGLAIIDLTAGREISGSTDLPHNHLLMIPEGGIILKARKQTIMMASFVADEH